MTAKVIQFPKAKKNSPPQTIDELHESIESVRKEHIEYIIDEIIGLVFNRCIDEGFDISNDDCNKPTALAIESIRALLYRTCHISHPFHDVAEDIFNLTDDNSAILSIDEELDISVNISVDVSPDE